MYQLAIRVRAIRVCALHCVRAVTSFSHYIRGFVHRRGHHVCRSAVRVSKTLTPGLRELVGVMYDCYSCTWRVPMSNATAERSFSCLRQLKNHLTNKLNQEYLDRMVFLHIHKYKIDQVDVITILQES